MAGSEPPSRSGVNIASDCERSGHGLSPELNLPPSEANKKRRKISGDTPRPRQKDCVLCNSCFPPSRIETSQITPSESAPSSCFPPRAGWLGRTGTLPIGNAATLIGSQAYLVAKRAIHFLLGVFQGQGVAWNNRSSLASSNTPNQRSRSSVGALPHRTHARTSTHSPRLSCPSASPSRKFPSRATPADLPFNWPTHPRPFVLLFSQSPCRAIFRHVEAASYILSPCASC